jgi:hypothetical protein
LQWRFLASCSARAPSSSCRSRLETKDGRRSLEMQSRDSLEVPISVLAATLTNSILEKQITVQLLTDLRRICFSTRIRSMHLVHLDKAASVKDGRTQACPTARWLGCSRVKPQRSGRLKLAGPSHGTAAHTPFFIGTTSSGPMMRIDRCDLASPRVLRELGRWQNTGKQ